MNCRPKLTDHEVVLVLQLVDAGLSYSQIAKKFEISKGAVADYVSGRRRGSLGGATVDEPASNPVEERMAMGAAEMAQALGCTAAELEAIGARLLRPPTSAERIADAAEALIQAQMPRVRSATDLMVKAIAKACKT